MKSNRLRQLISINFGLAVIFFGIESSSLFAQPFDETPVNFKIAFIGDQGLGGGAVAVLRLIKSENADAVVHLGDFDYYDDPAAWDAQINDILGEDFPYLASVGNHDKDKFYGSGGYQEFMEARMNRLGITWSGDLGVKSWLKYKGIFIVLTGPDVLGSGHSEYIRDKLAEDSSIWSISSWHKNMRAMQVGGKSDETGWGVYEESRKGGAIIATAHEHSYSRTHLLSSCENQTVASTSDTLILTKDLLGTEEDEGKTFVFVSGLAGRSIRDQERSGDWWASIYTSDQEANYGALFGTFNVNGVPNLAKFYFKDIDGVIPDSFVVISNTEDMATAPTADFTGSPIQGNTPLTVNFTDQSTGNITSWSWEFGDGQTSSQQNPSHTCQNPGKYTVKLTVTGPGGSDSKTRSNYITVDVATPVILTRDELPRKYDLRQNYSNPFNPETFIEYQLPKTSVVKLVIYNIVGQKQVTIVEGLQQAGNYRIKWDGKDHLGRGLPSGVYLYRLITREAVITKKLIIVR